MLYEKIKKQYERGNISDAVAQEVKDANDKGASDAQLYEIVKKYYASGSDVNDQGAQNIKDEFDMANNPDAMQMVDENNKPLTLEQQGEEFRKAQELESLSKQTTMTDRQRGNFQAIFPRVTTSIANEGIPDLLSGGTFKNIGLAGLDASSRFGQIARSSLNALGGGNFKQSMSDINPTSTNPVIAMGESIMMNPLTPFGGGLTSMGKSLGGRLAGSSAPAQFIGKNLGIGSITTGAEDAQRRLSGQEGVTPIEGALGMAIPFAGAGVSKMLSGKSINAPISANSSYSDLFTQAKTQITSPKNQNPSFTDIDELATKMFNKTSDVKTSNRSNIEIIPTQKDAIEVNDNVNALRESGGSLNLWNDFGSKFFPKIQETIASKLDENGKIIGDIDSQFLGASNIRSENVINIWADILKKKLGVDLNKSDGGSWIASSSKTSNVMMKENNDALKIAQDATDEILSRTNIDGTITDESLRAMEKALRGSVDALPTSDNVKKVYSSLEDLHEKTRDLVKEQVKESAISQYTQKNIGLGVSPQTAEKMAVKEAEPILEKYNNARNEFRIISQLRESLKKSTGKELDFSDELEMGGNKNFQRGGTALSRVTSQIGDQFTPQLIPYAQKWLGIDLPKEVAKIKASYKLANTELSKKSGGFIGNFKNSPLETIMEAIKRETNLTPEYLAKMIKNPRKDFDPNKNTLMGLTSKAVEKTNSIGSLSGANVQKSQEDAKKNKSKLKGKN